MAGGTEARSTVVGKWLFCAVVIGSAQAVGSLHSEVLVVMTALAALACALLWAAPPTRLSKNSRIVMVVVALLAFATFLQAVPLPAGVVRVLAPSNAAVWEGAFTATHESGPAWHSLSVAPGATHVELLRGLFYLCLFVGALKIAALEHGEKLLLRLIVFASMSMAFVALAHAAVSAERIFGVYRPREAYAYRPGRIAPLLNLNHLAAYLDIGACVAVASLVTRRTMPRALSGSAAIILIGMSVWQGSRGAVAALLIGVVVAIVLATFALRRVEGKQVEAGVVATCVAAAAIMVALSLSETAHERLASRELIKVATATTTLSLATRSPWAGFGRGAFETVFPSIHEGTTPVTFTNPENIVAQWVVEWGFPVALVAFAVLAWTLRPQSVLRAARHAIGPWVAVLITVLHDAVDFHLEVPGVTALTIVCVAVVVGGRESSRESVRRANRTLSAETRAREDEAGLRGASRARLLAFSLCPAVVLAIVWTVPDLGHSLAEDRRALSAMSIDTHTSRDAFRSAARAAMQRYPAESFFPLMGAVREQMVDGGNPIPWVARALVLNPRFGRAHFVLARSLAVSGREAQARLEYRLAYEYDDRLRDQIARESLRLVDDHYSASEMVPPGDLGVDLLDKIVIAIQSRLPSTAIVVDREITARAPNAVGPRKRAAEAALTDARDDASWCQKGACVEEALKISVSLANADPASCELRLLVARLRIAKGEVQGGLDELERAIENVTDRPSCQKELVTLAFANGQTKRADIVLEKLVTGGCGAASDCVDLYGWAAGIEESRGRYLRAARLYRRVIDIQPERDDLLIHIGELGVHPGMLADAVDAYSTLAQRHPGDPRWTEKAEELKARIRNQQDPNAAP